jgi:uncharacterized protein
MPKKVFIESRDEMETILNEESTGYLGLAMDNQPYVVPLTYVYDQGRILFHCALTGTKLDQIRANPHVCFTVAKQTGGVVRHPQGANCNEENDSVVCYGSARIVENKLERQKLLNIFNHHFQPDAAEISLEDAEKCYAVEIKIEKMTGRRQRVLEYTYWSYAFE